MHRCGVIVAGAVAASLYAGAGWAQTTPSDAATDTQPDTQPEMPEDVPPQFLRPQDAPQAAPAQNAPAPNAQSAPSPANGLSDAANGMVGAWEFSNADRDKICHFTFRPDPAPGGYKLDVDPNCPNLFPSAANMAGWSLDNYGDLHLLDAEGKDILDLSQVEGGMYDGFTPEEGRYILQAAAAAPTLTADDVAGDWAVTRGAGKPICVLTLANSPAGGALALTVKPGCDPFVMSFAPSAWRLDQGSLVLLSSHGQSWQFEASDPKTWQRVPDTADPVLLTKQ
ncbi:MAG: AprI/Inh family metalloprotease inhibitor [Xanthobacteraceae bacterium]